MRSSIGATTLILAMTKKSPITVKGRDRRGKVRSMTVEVTDRRGKLLDGWVVPVYGGTFKKKYANGTVEYWIGWTNYPAPHWNEWLRFVRVGDDVRGAYTHWFYGTWIPRYVV